MKLYSLLWLKERILGLLLKPLMKSDWCRNSPELSLRAKTLLQNYHL